MTASRTPAETRRLAQLEAEAKYARKRFDLYRAKVYGPRSSPGEKTGPQLPGL
jgi:hypothetical protein